MMKELRVDLRIARSRSGLSGNDMAHLMGCGKDRISKLENGAARLTPDEMVRLHLIYGERFEEVFAIVSQKMALVLFKRLGNMPQEPVHWAGKRTSRLATLDDLSERLQVYQSAPYDT